MPSLKIAICTPCYGNPELMFSKSLQGAIKHFYEANLTTSDGTPYEKEIEWFVVSNSMLTEGRHMLVAEALNWGADYLLWADADHVFPPDTICRLWARNVQIVGCNYSRRGTPTAPTAAKIVTDDLGEDHKNLCYTTMEKWHDDLLEEVDHLGLGLCLMRMDCFDALQVKAEEEGKDTFMPLFMFTPTEGFKGMIGEDVYFFKKLKEAGIPIYLDHGVSWEVGHIHKIVLTNHHAVKQEQDWIDQGKKRAKRYDAKISSLETIEAA